MKCNIALSYQRRRPGQSVGLSVGVLMPEQEGGLHSTRDGRFEKKITQKKRYKADKMTMLSIKYTQ